MTKTSGYELNDLINIGLPTPNINTGFVKREKVDRMATSISVAVFML